MARPNVDDARKALSAPGSYFELTEQDVRGVSMAVFAHRLRSMTELLEQSARFPDRVALVDGGTRIDFGTQLHWVRQIAVTLQRRFAIRTGDRVAIYAANRWEWAIAFWAIVKVGAIPSAYNGLWTTEEVTHASSLVKPALIIGDGARLARLDEPTTDAVRAIPRLDLDEFRLLLEENRGSEPDPVKVTEDDPAVLIFTSGTTGRAKAVSTPHRGILGFLQASTYGETLARMVMTGIDAPRVGDTLPLADDVVLVTSPLFHTSALYGAILRGVMKGTTVVLLPGRFDAERVLQTIEDERVTSWLALGSAAPRACAVPDAARYDTSSLVHIGVGGAPVSPAVQEAIRATFPGVRQSLTMGYSSTEAVSVVASIGGAEFLTHPTSTGRPAVNVEIELRDGTGVPVAEGELGEVHVRSPYLMLGYWDDPEASAAVLKPGGWLAMGDLGRLVDGRLYIESRARDLILVSAENVTPTEVEYRLEAHPDVIEAAVFAVDDPMTGDAVCAVVVAGEGSNLTAEDLAEWCRASLARYKVPTQWHVWHESLPRNATGKLLKAEIRSRALQSVVA
jgi:acyl-CoA synthetase (AMP-forming)/AMP-acid ligase II